ncbi:zinc finger CCCH domain-containing protein 13 [Drosophila gunungcola]|uniref:zinc finger CCCH domain-containing protein 13 n=1 Tax=Drosophila gunungcola TaxID=103775 RepID=UPI0022E981CB|nr:zinc finger CCCH domain-containing protein 13 [Drosophila gunungcola]
MSRRTLRRRRSAGQEHHLPPCIQNSISIPCEGTRRGRFQKVDAYPSIRTMDSHFDPTKDRANGWLASSVEADGRGRAFDMVKDNVLLAWQQIPHKDTLGFYGIGSPTHQPESVVFNRLISSCLAKVSGGVSRRHRPRNIQSPLSSIIPSPQICKPFVLNRQALQSQLQQMPHVQLQLDPRKALETFYCNGPTDPHVSFAINRRMEEVISRNQALKTDPKPNKKPHNERPRHWFCPMDCGEARNVWTQYEWAKYKLDPRPLNKEFREWLQRQKEQKSPEPKDYDELYKRFLKCFEPQSSPDPLCKIYEDCCKPKKPKENDNQGGADGHGGNGDGFKPGPPSGDDGKPNGEDKTGTGNENGNGDEITGEENDKEDRNNNNGDVGKENEKNRDNKKDTLKDKDKTKHKNKDKVTDEDKNKDKDTDEGEDKDKEKNKDKDMDIYKDTDRDKDKEKEKDTDKYIEKDKEKDKYKEEYKGKEKEKKNEKEKEKEKENEKEKEKDKDKDRGTKEEEDKHHENDKDIGEEKDIDEKLYEEIDKDKGKEDKLDKKKNQQPKPPTESEKGRPSMIPNLPWANEPQNPSDESATGETDVPAGYLETLEPEVPKDQLIVPPKRRKRYKCNKEDAGKRRKSCKPCPRPSCECRICHFQDRRDEPEAPFMRDMRRQEQRRQQRAYYRQMCHREYIRNRCCEEEYRAPPHKCDPICCDNFLCRNPRLAKHCDCLAAVQELQKLLSGAKDQQNYAGPLHCLENLRRRVCQRMCDCILP